MTTQDKVLDALCELHEKLKRPLTFDEITEYAVVRYGIQLYEASFELTRLETRLIVRRHVTYEPRY